MDILIVFLLLVVAVCLLFNRPINIVIHHKHGPAQAAPEPAELPEDIEQRVMNLDSVIRAINDVMEVEQYGQED